MSQYRYSPLPIKSYGISGHSKLLAEDDDAWNLAYLSWDCETNQLWPDAHFSTHVRRSLQFVLATGEIDLCGSIPTNRTVRAFMHGPAPAVAYRITRMERLKELPLYLAYGDSWLQTLAVRSKAFREPDDCRYDWAVEEFSQAQRIIEKLRIEPQGAKQDRAD